MSRRYGPEKPGVSPMLGIHSPNGTPLALRAATLIGTVAALALLIAMAPLVRGQQAWSFKTDDTSLTISAGDDGPILTSLAATQGETDWISRAATLPLPEQVLIDKHPRPLNWRFLGAAQNGTSNTTLFRFRSANPEVELLSIWRAEPGPGPVENHFEIVNHSDRTVEIPLLAGLQLPLTAPPGVSLENWWVEKGASRPSDEGTHREPIHAGYEFHGRSTPYSDTREMIPWVSIQDANGKAGVYFGIEFSGRVGIDLIASGKPGNVRITAGLDASEGSFRSRLNPGERFVSPTILVGCYRGDVDDGANRLHRFVASHLRPPVSDPRYPLVVNNSWGSGMAVDEKLARQMIDDSSALGVELFHIDAGWFRGVGDWRPNEKKFPNGLIPIRDYAHRKGMLFGLWVGWTQGGTEARGMETLAVTNPVQRDWFTHDYPAGWKPSDFTGATVCLGDPDARDWCFNELRRIVDAYQLDLLEHDQVMIVDQCDRTDHEHTASPADIAYHAARGYEWIYDRLRKEHPGLLFEDCVNGGHTVDFGIVRRTHYISITDTYDPMSNRRAFYDASFPLPPSMCECYIANHPGPSLATFRTMLRSGMMGWCTLMCDTGAWSPQQHAAAKREIEIYKERIRPLINNGNLYHISARPDDTHWDGMEYFDPDTGKGLVFAFRGSKAPDSVHPFRLKGIAGETSYRVWSQDGSLAPSQSTGSMLMNQGLEVRLREPGASDLIYLEAR